jgi:hypothetical protein
MARTRHAFAWALVAAAVAASLVIVRAEAAGPSVTAGGPYSGEAGRPVQFAATTDVSAISAVYWEFGDGSSDRGLLATKIFDAPGVYDVTITVKDEAGRVYTAVTTATIHGDPRPGR